MVVTQDVCGGDCIEPATPAARSGRGGAIGLLVAGLSLVLVIGVAGWQGVELFAAQRAQQVDRPAVDRDTTSGRTAAMAAAETFAQELTAIDWHTIDDDVRSVLDLSTHPFRDDFEARKAAFIDAVRQAKSVSTAVINGSGVVSMGRVQASVLVAVTVTTVNGAAVSPLQPRSWRVKIGLLLEGGRFMVSSVEFVR